MSVSENINTLEKSDGDKSDHTTNHFKDVILKKLDELGNGSNWLWITFFLCLTPSILNGFHASSYVFLGQMPDDYWCTIPELITKGNWTKQQMINITSTESKCRIYDYDYSLLSQMSFDDALQVISSSPKPPQIRCTEKYNSFIEYNQKPGISIVPEWNLICDKIIWRTNVQMALSVGKFFGASLLGIIADRFGRKFAFTISAVLYMIGGPLSFLTPWYWLFFVSRFILGVAGAGVYHSAYTLLTEVTSTKHRAWTSVVYSISYPIGTLLLALIAYEVQNWRSLQACLTLPAFILIIHCVWLDESPRWLVNKNKLSSAYQIVFRENNPKLKNIEEAQKICQVKSNNEEYTPVKERLKKAFHEISILYGTTKIRNRLFICQFAWFVSSFSYYVIALNAENFSANRYIYIAMVGLFEIPSCAVPIAILKCCGRRSTSLLLFYAAGASLLVLFIIPVDENLLTTFTAMFGRFCISAVFIVVILHTAELFPTEVRNSSIGTSSTMAHIGSISAPYVVDFLGTIVWFIPTTICAVVAICAGTLVMLLPETKGKDLHDRINEADIVVAGSNNVNESKG